MSSSSCGCGTPKQTYVEELCTLVPEYDPGCNACGTGKIPYGKGTCVFICRDGEHGQNADVYQSPIANNTTHPVDGSRDVPPTWVLRSICAAFRPAPIVKGEGVTSETDPITGQVSYTVAQAGGDGNTTYEITQNANGSQSLVGSDGQTYLLNMVTAIPNTDQTCKISAFSDPSTGSITISETCYDKDDNVVSGPTPKFVIEKGAIDTINAISNPNADGQIFITRPDLTVECVYDCATVDQKVCDTTPTQDADKPWIYNYKDCDGNDAQIDISQPPSCLPLGAHSLNCSVPGTEEFTYPADFGAGVRNDPTVFDEVEYCQSCKTFTVEDFPCLAEEGRNISILGVTNVSLFVDAPDYAETPLDLGPISFGSALQINGVDVITSGDTGAVNHSGHNETVGENLIHNHVTDGNDLTICIVHYFNAQKSTIKTGDTVHVDRTTSSIFIGSS